MRLQSKADAAQALQAEHRSRATRDPDTSAEPRSLAWLVTLLGFLAFATLLFSFYRPGLLLSHTTATGGDMGAHVYGAWFMREELLPRGLLSGWSDGWFAGFPIFHFYFPLVPALQALLSYLIPFDVAFKLGTVLGPLFLPVAAFMLFRLLRVEFPGPIVAAFLSIGFLFMDGFTIFGGNIASALVGEYSYSLSLGLCLVFTGLSYRVATETGGRPVLAAIVLALAALSHLVPVIMVVALAPLLLFFAARAHGLARGVLQLGTVFGIAFALTAFWSIPFLARLGYTTNMHWLQLDGWGSVLPKELWIYLAAAIGGVVLALVRRDRRMVVILVPSLLAIVIYFALPDGRVYNGRFVPFWYLGIVLASAYFVGGSIPSLARVLWRRRASAMSFALVAGLWGIVGGWVQLDRGPSYVDDWIRGNYQGYEVRSDYPELAALMGRIEQLPPGRVMWEPSDDLHRFGTELAPMLLPYWAGHPSMEGLYYESSITAPFHFLTAAEIAEDPSNPIAGLPYEELDLRRGIAHMQLLDVAYYVTWSDAARREALAFAALTPVAHAGHFWIFSVDGSERVVVPRYEPAVLEDADWVGRNIEWFSDPADLDVPLVADGPENWARVSSAADPLPRTALPHGGTTFEAQIVGDQISFHTDAIGEPHWVKVSYFPNWTVDGARGPYLASPSMMMVIPTGPEVRLRYERTWAEWLGLTVTASALVGLVVTPFLRGLRRRTRG